MTANTWGARLKARREELGLTQVRLAELAETTQQSVSRFEQDEVTPRYVTLVRYAEALRTTVEDLFPVSAVV